MIPPKHWNVLIHFIIWSLYFHSSFVSKYFLSTAEMRIVVKPAHVVMKYLLFLYFKSESKSVNVWRKEMLQSVYPLYTFPDNIYFVYVPGKNTFEPKINYLLKVFLRLTEKFLRIFLRSLITCVNAACIHLNKMYTPLFAQFIGMPLLKHSSFLHHTFFRIFNIN